MSGFEILGMLFLMGLGLAYPEYLKTPPTKEDMRRYGAIDTPPYLNPPTPRP